jgi:hypothetical protein
MQFVDKPIFLLTGDDCGQQPRERKGTEFYPWLLITTRRRLDAGDKSEGC